MGHHTSLLQKKVIVHFDEAYGWRESFLRRLSSHIAQLFISSPGDILLRHVSTERNWKWWFACARDLCHHSGDLHRAGKQVFFEVVCGICLMALEPLFIIFTIFPW